MIQAWGWKESGVDFAASGLECQTVSADFCELFYIRRVNAAQTYVIKFEGIQEYSELIISFL